MFALLDTLPCSLPCGTDDQDYENHLYVDCPGVGQVARGLRIPCVADGVFIGYK